MAGFEQLSQRLFINQSATRAIDDPHALFGFGEVFSRQDVCRLIRERHVQRYEIGACQQLIQFDLFDLHLLGFFFAEEGIVGHNLHLKPTRAVAHDAADVTRADNAKSFAGQFNTHELGLFPFAGMGGFAGFWDLTRNGEHHRNRMLGGGDHVAERRVHDDHALLGRGVFVDIVSPDPGAADDFEVVSSGEDCRCHFRG